MCLPSTKKGEKKQRKEETRQLDYNRIRAQRPSWARQKEKTRSKDTKEKNKKRKGEKKEKITLIVCIKESQNNPRPPSPQVGGNI